MAGVGSHGSPTRESHCIADHRDNGGQTQAIGQHPHGKRADELQQDPDWNVIHVGRQPHVEARKHHAQDDPAAASQHEHRRDAPVREHATRRRGHGNAVDQQCAGVVEQTLALQYHDQSMRRSQAAQHGGRRGGVRRRHDRTERNSRCPTHPGNEQPRDHGDRSDRYADDEECQTADGDQVLFQVAWRGVIGGIQQHGRHEQSQGELRVEHDLRRSRNQRECGTGQGEERRVRHTDLVGPECKHCTDQQQRDDQLKNRHGPKRRLMKAVDGTQARVAARQ